jgi:hypothetical protein
MFAMEEKNQETGSLDYQALCDLAKSRNIKCVEARGLDLRKGVRFHKDESEWIAIDIDLPLNEKIRTLGYLLEHEPETIASELGIEMGGEKSSTTPVLTLCCS